jgi:hypothetical protein
MIRAGVSGYTSGVMFAMPPDPLPDLREPPHRL